MQGPRDAEASAQQEGNEDKDEEADGHPQVHSLTESEMQQILDGSDDNDEEEEDEEEDEDEEEEGDHMYMVEPEDFDEEQELCWCPVSGTFM